ncbi:MAG: VOC family protein [Acetobacteraceae bacterium]|nr:VOC family protein [Acetobacteraceae bacterium]
MSQKPKGRIRHFAISVADPWAAAEFYKETFGLEELGESDGKLAEGVYLTDGVINLALLRFKSDEAAQGTGKDFVGLHHVGFWVDDAIATGMVAKANGATWIMGDPQNKGGYEVKYTDPAGVIFDIAEDGWAGSQKNPGATDNIVHPNTRRRIAHFEERRKQARRTAEARREGEKV